MDQGIESLIDRFGRAFARRDIDALTEMITEDCVFESTPAPDGNRYEGKPAVKEIWSEIFAANPNARWDTEEVIVAGDRAVVRWVFWFTGSDADGHVRGIDVFRVRDGKVAEKLSYVKG